MSQKTEAKHKSERIYYIDWLRIFAVLLLIHYHVAQIFNPFDNWHIQNDTLNEAFGIGNKLIHMWHMPLLMLLAGAGTWFALNFRTPKAYLNERIKRIFLPFVFGTLLIVPPQVYFERLLRGQFEGSYLAFYPRFFMTGIYPDGNLSYHHLWFMIYLFTYVVVLLPLLIYLRGEHGQRIISSLAALTERRGGLFLLALPIMISESLLRPGWPGWQNFVNDWANQTLYPGLFLLGFILYADERFQRAIQREGKTSLFLALSAYALLIFFNIVDVVEDGYNFPYMFLRGAVYTLGTWAWVMTFLAAGQKFLNKKGRLLNYASEAALPFYILHQTVIVVIGYYVIQWDGSLWAKYIIIAVLSLVGTIAIYDICVKRTNVTRFLFGMKPLRKQSSKAVSDKRFQQVAAMSANQH